MLSDYMVKKIGKMISCENNNEFYDINERFAAKLLNAGFIEKRRWSELHGEFLCTLSCYCVTDAGKKAFEEWYRNCAK